eukprot:810760-Lingulodinium_polyedra.AAC.1
MPTTPSSYNCPSTRRMVPRNKTPWRSTYLACWSLPRGCNLAPFRGKPLLRAVRGHDTRLTVRDQLPVSYTHLTLPTICSV